MAGRVPYAAATLSEAAAGERLPSLAVALAYVRACGGDEAGWERRWRAASAAVEALPPGLEGGECPYPGLARFEPADHARFFGRDRPVAELVALVRERRFAVLVGASGSGKSSLLRAGLVPALRNAEPPADRPAAVRILTPGEQPFRVHAVALAPVPAAGAGDTWVIVDQFEELFTLCQDREERTRFLDALLSAAEPGGRTRVVVSLRADFYGRLAEHADLAEAVRRATLLVGPMSPEELRAAIVKPAATQGLIVERALTARIVSDVEGEPGGLPMMSHALRETWRRRHGRTLTLADYEAAGGIHGAIAHTAERLYTSLSPTQAELTRHLLLRLITPGDGTQDTRRPAPRPELESGETEDAGPVLDQLARARLITLDEDTVDLAHEALITAWPRLGSWLDQDRARLRLHRHLTEAAASWHQLNRDPGALYRGTRLAAAEEAFPPEEREPLTALERTFLTTSLRARERERRTATRTTRRLRTLTGGLSLLLVFSLVTTMAAVREGRNATTAELVALSRQLAAQSTALLPSDPDLAALLAIEAHRTSPTTEATASLYSAAALPLRHRLTGHGASVQGVAFSPDGDVLTTTGLDGTLRRWDTRTGEPVVSVESDPEGFASSMFSPDGRTLATTGADGTLRLRNATTGESLAAFPEQPGNQRSPLAFSPDGAVLATMTGSGAVVLSDTVTGQSMRTFTGFSPERLTATFAPDGRALALADGEGTVRVLEVSTGRARSAFTIPGASAAELAFSPDGRALATADVDGTVRIRDAGTGRALVTLAHPGNRMPTVVFSPDGSTLATAGDDGTARLWDAATGRLLATLTGHTGWVVAVVFSPDGSTLATASDDGTARLWDVPVGRGARLEEPPRDMSAVAFNSVGTMLATAGDDGAARLWDSATGRLLATLTGHTGPVAAVAFSPDDTIVATAGEDGKARLWDVASGRELAMLTAYNGPLSDVTFSPDGGTLAVIDAVRVRLWDIASRRPVTSWWRGGDQNDVSFSPDAATLVTVRLWDVTGDEAVASWWRGGAPRDMSSSLNAAGLGSAREDSPVHVVDITSRRPREAFADLAGMVRAVAISPDGATLATADDNGETRLWDLATGRAGATLPGPAGVVRTVAFSPDGATLATANEGGEIRLWDVATRRVRAALTGHTSAVRALAFGPDGATLTSADVDGTVQRWNLTLPDPADAIDAICRAVGRDLTAVERSQYLPERPDRPVCPAGG
ncbi:WD40 repeat domain-containing protein [Streptomyces mayteni]